MLVVVSQLVYFSCGRSVVLYLVVAYELLYFSRGMSVV